MKIALIGQGFEKDVGQGIEKYCGYLAEGISKKEILEKVEIKYSQKALPTIFTSFFGSFFRTLKIKADIYHFTIPELFLPGLFKRPSIVTVYDLIPMVLKDERKKSFNLFFKIIMNFAKKANHIIAISQSTVEDLIKYLNVPREKISLVYPGVDHEIFFPTNRKQNKKFIVGFLGGLAKRKNAKIVLDVAEILKKEKIIFRIGGKGAGFSELKESKEKRDLDNVEFTGFIPDDELSNFYNSLDLFLAPTTYDGFCMPGLEAMACGCPIITANTGALPEVAGNAGITINPNDAKEIANAILKVMKDSNLRKEMSKKSLEHSKKFSWEKCVKDTMEVYNKIFENGRRKS